MATLTKSVKCRLTFTTTSEDLLLVPQPRDASPISVKQLNGEQEAIAEREHKPNLTIRPYGNSFRLHSASASAPLVVEFTVPSFPTPPNIDPHSEVLLANNERFTKWQTPNLGNKLIKEKKVLVLRKYSDYEKALLLGQIIMKKFIYSVERDRYVYIDELFSNSKPVKQDCLGYHSTWVGAMRSIGIPAVLDVGFRLDNQDSPHVWAWFFDRQQQKWVSIDLNDHATQPSFGFGNHSRVSMTLGTTHHVVNVANFPETVASFIQYGLGSHRVTNQPPFTRAVFNTGG